LSKIDRLARPPDDPEPKTDTVAAPVEVDRTAVAAKGARVQIRDLTKRFGDKTVLSGLSLDIPAGQFVSIIGRSGCGKSTLLRLLIGLDAPTSGTIEIDGEPLNARSTKARIVFQEPRLLPWERVGANVAVGLGEGGDRAGRDKAVTEALADVGLRDRIGDWPSVLSGGQKQRVALARALVSHPQFLVLDEPLGALDALTRITMQSLVERVWLMQGMTTILVTHDVSEAVALADRVIVLDAGQVALDLNVDLPRPRERGDPRFAKLEGALLDAIFGVADTVY
jgi:sulfonate transport system ATP-binding protein